MAEALHTPGPWVVSFDATRYGIYRCEVIGGKPYRRTPIAWVPKLTTNHACDEAERQTILQDARLIAAAPDMLAALQLISDGPHDAEAIADMLGQVRAAIAKATGAQHA